MRWSWLPWQFLLRRAAKAHGFLDPIALFARLRHLAQPSEVSEPIELLRAGVAFHARGLVNTRVIQHNLDWVWPYWIERQFDPNCDSFLPRAFSITHVNLTHRNWTAVGRPDLAELPIVDPRGLVTPFYDGWSLDAWLLGDDGRRLYPSRAPQASQRLLMEDDGLAVETEVSLDDLHLRQRAWVDWEQGRAVLRLACRAEAAQGARLALALRPYNPEGISFIHEVALEDDGCGWRVDGTPAVRFADPADAHHVSDYRRGDVAIHLGDPGGLSWAGALAGTARLQGGDARYRFLYEAALRTLLLHSVEDVYPGPFTYKRFWFRDAAFICHALLAVGLGGRARRALARFPERQNRATGYFHSQEGEWDSNGQALWIMARYAELTGEALPAQWLDSLRRGARWIARKRLGAATGAPHAGLLPAGFSAEHLGPNDYYYWDDLWSLGGLRAASALFAQAGEDDTAGRLAGEADDLEAVLQRALARDAGRLGRAAIPASPYRRLDAGAVGSLAIGYPLQLCAPDDAGLLGTTDYLMDHARVRGGFFQDMIHSGINAYLTLHLAQVLLRARDPRCLELMEAVVGLASETGQWPEAIHPRTLGGCMGDGQHVWAAAEWVLMLRNAFVREEGGRLVLAAGIPRSWLEAGEPLVFGPAPTRFGAVNVRVEPDPAGAALTVRWDAEWRRPPEGIDAGPVWAAAVSAAAEAGVARVPLEGGA